MQKVYSSESSSEKIHMKVVNKFFYDKSSISVLLIIASLENSKRTHYITSLYVIFTNSVVRKGTHYYYCN